MAIHQQVRDSIVPIYQQIRNRSVEAIAAGELPAVSGLPATRQLAVDLGINFHTRSAATSSIITIMPRLMSSRRT